MYFAGHEADSFYYDLGIAAQLDPVDAAFQSVTTKACVLYCVDAGNSEVVLAQLNEFCGQLLDSL